MDEVPSKSAENEETLNSGNSPTSMGGPLPDSTAERTQSAAARLEAAPERAPPDLVTQFPARLAEFELRERLGQGGFGCVYAGYDTVLRRDVAIKIPRRLQAGKTTGIDQYLHEARAIAALDHPHILPVYQAATTPQVPLFIVMKWIDGTDLGKWAAIHKPSHSRVASMVATVAEALAYAHARNIIHRDIKPANILVDQDDKPYLADFGLALTEVDFHDGPVYIGTVPYMSPEQARGEGHRVDGRSDIFSLGIVLYQLLVGVRPFRGADRRETLLAIRNAQPEHPRRLNPALPKELSRICLRALAKHKTERYPTADEFAGDLHEFLRREEISSALSVGVGVGTLGNDQVTTTFEVGSEHSRDQIPVVPKGLRPFETNDAEFFTRLLPGPYDRNGVPEKIRFWKAKIESRLAQQACSVGVIYGPSGCGKTSLFRAGLLPRLSPEIVVICVEATPHNTEAVIFDAINQSLDIPAEISSQAGAGSFDHELVALFAWLRRHSAKKVVLCIDQFEQWLLAHSATLEHAALTEALRQCDGAHLQCILLVRDDFWMGVTRLMQALEQEISEQHNASCVDLFDQRHARKVLALFGHAFGKLPEDEEALTSRQNRFLDAAIDYLSTDGRVICVQLALLAEMMKHRSWNESNLLSKDGGAGIGVRFLEQIFDSESSLRRYRRHAEGTQKVLRLLLPESGVRIKGSIRSEQELFEACGYSDMASFRELLRILDAELHLITPTDRRDDESMSSHSVSGNLAFQETGYQLTHDFLIAPVRRWLELRQLGTRAGQAQVRLEEYTDLYRARTTSHSLPTLLEYLMIRSRLDPATWNEAQQRMMHAARSFYRKKVGRWVLIAMLMFAVAIGGWKAIAEHQAARLAQATVDGVLGATMSGVIERAGTLRKSEQRTLDMLLTVQNNPALPMLERMRGAMITAPTNPQSRELIWQGFDELSPADVVLIARNEPVASIVPIEKVRATWKSGRGTAFRQLSAACLLAHDDSFREELIRDMPRLTPYLLNENPMLVSHWMDGFEPVREALLDELVGSFEQILQQSNTRIVNASNLIARYAKDQPEVLAAALAQSNETAFPIFLPPLRQHPRGLDAIRDALSQRAADGHDSPWQVDLRGVDWWEAPDQPQSKSAGAATAESRVSPSSLLKKGADPLRPHNSSALQRGLPSPPFRQAAKTEQPTLDLEAVSRVAKEAVVGNAHFVLCHSIDNQVLPRLIEHLTAQGFRVASLRPHGAGKRDGTSERLMVVFKRDGRKSVWTSDSPVAELKSLHERYRDEGYFADDVAAYSLDDEHSFVYSAVWTDRPPLPTVLESDMYIHVPAPKHQIEGWDRFNQRGFVPRANVLTMNASGDEHFTSVRWRLTDTVRYTDPWNDPIDWYSAVAKWSPDTVLLQQRLGARPAAHPMRGVTALCWNGIPIESKWTEYQPLAEHRRACRELCAAGYRPMDIHVTEISGRSELGYSSTWWRPLPDYADRSRRRETAGRLIIAAHALGDSEPTLASLASSDDAELRAGVIDAFSRYQMPAGWLADQLRDAKEIAVRRGAALALALYPEHAQTAALKSEIQSSLEKFAPSCADPGLRSGIDALCMAWGIPKTDWTDHRSTQELVTPQKERMVVIHPTDPVWLGSPANEPGRDSHQEPQYAVRINHPYAISANEVTIEKYLQFHPSAQYPDDYCPTVQCPMIEVTWFEAARYCRWLSEQESVDESQMCYPPVEEIKPGMRLEPDYLDRTGYRLPTEAEWEFASRGGYTESRHFGFSPQLLNQYAWTAQNSQFRCHATATRLPNDYGLFDMLGNAMEWCHDRRTRINWPMQGVMPTDASLLEAVQGDDRMSSRGGAVLFQPLDARSAHRNDHVAGEHRVYLSFRIARTVR